MEKRIAGRASIIVLSILIIMQMFPMQIFAEEQLQGSSASTVYYTDADGSADTHEATVLTDADKSITTLTTGWYAIKGDVTITNSAYNSLTCDGNINLILLDGASLTVNATLGTAIKVPSGASLTITSGSESSSAIEGTGTLTCKGANNDNQSVYHSAGIGFDYYLWYPSYAGDIVINGGIVNATGASSHYPGPGIGSLSDYYSGGEISGSLTVNGGSVSAIAGSNTRSVGNDGCSGIDFCNGSNCKGFYVNGGELYAEGSNDCAAVFADGGCKESIISKNIGIIGDETTAVDHADKDITSTLRNYGTLRFVEGVNYVDANGNSHTLPGTQLTSESTALNAADSVGGIFYTKQDLTINKTLTVTGDVRLIMADNSTLTVNGKSAGINVPSGNSLTIEAGNLIASGGSSVGAGIGSGSAKACGAITINNADVTANGSYSAPGIGGCSGTDGTITVNAGTVKATGGSGGGSGIGGVNNVGGEIVINGGEIIAEGIGNGAGIGGSGNITLTINGGNITATGGSSSSAIGGAGIGGSYDNGNGIITINNGTVNATGGSNSAGIGAGASNGSSYITGKAITVNGGTVTAQGGNGGAGIGGGFRGCASEVVINDGNVNATGGSQGAGIGSGYYGGDTVVTINNGTVTVKGGKNAAGIGGGYKGKCGTVELNCGLVKAEAGTNASAIGAGYNGSAGTITADAEELLWAAADEKASEKTDAAVSNDGDNLYSTLEGKAYVYANHAINSEGIKIEKSYIGTDVPDEDYDTIKNNLKQITITVKDRIKRKDAQLEILTRVVQTDNPDWSENKVKDYVNSVLRDETKSVNIGISIVVIVENSNLQGGDDAYIEYKLIPTAVVTGAIDGECEFTIEDFRNQDITLEVTMPTCGTFTPGSVSHTNDDGSITYETFSQDGTKKFSYNSDTKTVTVSIEHCSNLRINAKKAVNTGDSTDIAMLPMLIVIMLLAALGAACILRRKTGIR